MREGDTDILVCEKNDIEAQTRMSVSQFDEATDTLHNTKRVAIISFVRHRPGLV